MPKSHSLLDDIGIVIEVLIAQRDRLLTIEAAARKVVATHDRTSDTSELHGPLNDLRARLRGEVAT